MNEAEKRMHLIESLDTRRILGARADGIRREMQPWFDALRDIYLKQLVENTKTLGSVDNHTAMALVVLADLENLLKREASRGAKASRSLEKTIHAGGSNT